MLGVPCADVWGLPRVEAVVILLYWTQLIDETGKNETCKVIHLSSDRRWSGGYR